MSAPRNMWECHECGDYVENYVKVCPRCKTPKREPVTGSMYIAPVGRHAASDTAAQINAATTDSPERYTAEPSGPVGGSFAAKFMKLIALVLWIGGLIVAIVTANVDTGRYYAEFFWGIFLQTAMIYALLGAFAWCIAELFENIQRIADSLQQISITKSKH